MEVWGLVIQGFLGLVFSLVRALITVLPALPRVPFDLMGSLAAVGELLWAADFFVPLDLLGVYLGVWVAAEVLHSAKALLDWLIAKIPTIE